MHNSVQGDYISLTSFTVGPVGLPTQVAEEAMQKCNRVVSMNG